MMLKRDMIEVQEAPSMSISTQRTADERSSAKLKMIAANVAIAIESRASVESFDRVR
jgi:hypothetical protein